MALTVGTDTYISLADCESYLAGQYIVTDTKYSAWLFLTSADREILLRKAARLIDRQPLQGYKYLTNQAMAFPRFLYTEYDMSEADLHPLLRANGFYCDGSVPDEIKYAQCEIAVQMTQASSERMEMQRQGVKSFSLGSLSETYSGVKNGGIDSYEAIQLLAPYAGGGFRI